VLAVTCFFVGQIGQEGPYLHLGQRGGIVGAVKGQKALDPLAVGFFGPVGVVSQTDYLSQGIGPRGILTSSGKWRRFLG
jgi:hypothetical protein